MAGEDEVVVHIPVDGDGGDDLKVVVDKGKTELENANFNDDDPVENLKNQFATMTARATAAENQNQALARELDQTKQRVHHVETEVVTSQMETVVSGIAAAEAEATAAEQAYQQAFEAGDGAAMARAQRAIAKATARAERLTEAKEDLEEEVETRKTKPAPRQQPPRAAPADPVERLASSLTPKSAAWVRAHPEVATDMRKNRLMLAADHLAQAEGIAVESDEYFAFVESYVNKGSQKDQPKRDGTRPTSAAAAGGSSGGNLNGGKREVRLTAGEAASATDGTLVWNYDDPTGKSRFKKGDPIGLVEMARRKAEGMKAGLYDRNNVDA